MSDQQASNPEENELTPSELVKKHISDKEHVITNEELDHLKIGAEAESKDELEKEVEEKLEEDGLSDEHETNSYDLLDI